MLQGHEAQDAAWNLGISHKGNTHCQCAFCVLQGKKKKKMLSWVPAPPSNCITDSLSTSDTKHINPCQSWHSLYLLWKGFVLGCLKLGSAVEPPQISISPYNKFQTTATLDWNARDLVSTTSQGFSCSCLGAASFCQVIHVLYCKWFNPFLIISGLYTQGTPDWQF